MSNKIKKWSIRGVLPQIDVARMPFGRQIEHLKAIQEFKAGCKSVYLSQKRQTYAKAIREAIKLYNVDEYYCEFYCDSMMKDDSFEFFYTTKATK